MQDLHNGLFTWFASAALHAAESGQIGGHVALHHAERLPLARQGLRGLQDHGCPWVHDDLVLQPQRNDKSIEGGQ